MKEFFKSIVMLSVAVVTLIFCQPPAIAIATQEVNRISTEIDRRASQTGELGSLDNYSKSNVEFSVWSAPSYRNATRLLVVAQTLAVTSDPVGTVPPHIVEQYKAYLLDIGNIGTRYATAHGFYVAVVSALIAFLSFKDVNRPVSQFFGVASIAVAFFIAIICLLWWDTLQYFGGVFEVKFKILREMESLGLHQLFQTEDKRLTEAGLKPGLISREMRIVFVIGGAALFFALAGTVFQIAKFSCRRSPVETPSP
jgi:hypothetical protein